MTNLGVMCTLFLAEFLSQSGQLGTNPSSFAAPPAVPEPAPLIRGAAGGLGADTPTGVPPTESPGEVLPMIQEDVPPPNFSVRVSASVARSGAVSLGGSLASAKLIGFPMVRTNCVLLVFLLVLVLMLRLLYLLVLFFFLFLIMVLLPCLLLFPPLLLLLLLCLPLPPSLLLLSLPLFFPLPLGVFLPCSLLLPLRLFPPSSPFCGFCCSFPCFCSASPRGSSSSSSSSWVSSFFSVFLFSACSSSSLFFLCCFCFCSFFLSSPPAAPSSAVPFLLFLPLSLPPLLLCLRISFLTRLVC